MKRSLLVIIGIFSSLIILADNFLELKNKADEGDAEAQYDLACWYIDGDGPDYGIALDYLRKSEKQGNENAKKLLYKLTFKGYNGWGDYEPFPFYGNIFLNKEYLDEFIENDIYHDECVHGENALIAAHNYYYNYNYEKAVEYYKLTLQIIDNNHKYYAFGPDPDNMEDLEFEYVKMDALTMLAYCYEWGLGVKQNVNKAHELYDLGVQDFSYDDQDRDGSYSLNEKGDTITDDEKLESLFNNPNLCGVYYDGFVPIAGERNLARDAMNHYFLTSLKLKKYKVFQDLDDNSFTQRVPFYSLWMAERYYKGLGCQQQFDKAFKLFQIMVLNDDWMFNSGVEGCYPEVYADACYRLYECYAYGRGTEKNPNKAEQFYKLALRYGSSSAIFDNQKRYEIIGN